MTLYDYLAIFRRRWLLLIGLPLFVALFSFGLSATQPPRYQVSTRVIVTRGVTDENSTAGMTWAREDTVAQDLPTIISSPVFARDVAEELQRRGTPVSEAALSGGLRGAHEGKIVTITATSPSSEDATAIAEAAVAMLQANGLRYWGDPTWTPEQPGINIGPLDGPASATRIPTQRELLIDAVIRGFVGMLVALALAIGLNMLEERREQHARQATHRTTVS